MNIFCPCFEAARRSFVALMADSDGRCDQVRILEEILLQPASSYGMRQGLPPYCSIYIHLMYNTLVFVKMYFFNACYRRFVNNQVLFSSVQRHQIIFATKDFSRGELFVLTVIWLTCIWLTLIHSKFVNCPCCSFLSLWYFLLQIKFLYRLSICVNLTMYLLWLYL